MSTQTSMPSELPQLDHLVELLSGRKAAPRVVRSAFQALDEAIGFLYGSYEFELQFFEYREDVSQVCDEMLECFHRIRPLQADIRDEISAGQSETALKMIGDLRGELRTLFDQFAQLKTLMDQGPQYSKLPFTQELLRVAYLYLEEQLPLSAVQSRLDVFCNFHDNLELELEKMSPSPSERQAFEEHQADLEEALAAQVQGIEDLDLALESGAEESIREALELLADAASTLVEFYELLRYADQKPDTLSCFRCGTENNAQARRCGQCSAVLPRSEGETATSTMQWNEDGSSGQSGQSSEYLKIQAAAEQAMDTGNSSELIAVLADYRHKLEQNQNRLNHLKAPPKDIPAEHLQVLNQGKQEFAAIVEQLTQGLELMDEGAPGPDPGLLRRGLEELSVGFQKFEDFQKAFQQAEGLAS